MIQANGPNQNIYANLISYFDSDVSPCPGGPYGNFPDYYQVGSVGGNQYGLTGNDYLDARQTLLNDADLQADPHHFIWYGFYRRLGTGAVRFASVVCKQRRGAIYSEQDMSSAPGLLYQNPFNTPAGLAPNRRLPVPWRVSVGHEGGRQLSNRVSPQMLGATGAGLGSLAPAGSKLMIQGTVYPNPSSDPVAPVTAGRLLTVANVVNITTIDVLEDISDLPTLDFASGQGSTFDVWLVPPAVESGAAANESPALVWRMTL